MNDRFLTLILFSMSMAESLYALPNIWPTHSRGRQIESLCFAFLPTLLWAFLVIRIKVRGLFRRLYFITWFLALPLCSLTLYLLLDNQWAGLGWYGLQFWWGILGFSAWTGVLLVAIFRWRLTSRSSRTPPALPGVLFLVLAISASFNASVQAGPLSFIR